MYKIDDIKYFYLLAIYVCIYVYILICNIYSDSVTQCYVIIVWKANINVTDSQTIHILFAEKLILLHLSITTDNICSRAILFNYYLILLSINSSLSFFFNGSIKLCFIYIIYITHYNIFYSFLYTNIMTQHILVSINNL